MSEYSSFMVQFLWKRRPQLKRGSSVCWTTFSILLHWMFCLELHPSSTENTAVSVSDIKLQRNWYHTTYTITHITTSTHSLLKSYPFVKTTSSVSLLSWHNHSATWGRFVCVIDSLHLCISLIQIPCNVSYMFQHLRFIFFQTLQI